MGSIEYGDLIFTLETEVFFEPEPKCLTDIECHKKKQHGECIPVFRNSDVKNPPECRDDLKNVKCTKTKDEHGQFVNVNDFEKKLPKKCQDPLLIQSIRIRSELTVKILVAKNSPDRPKYHFGNNNEYTQNVPRYGTGYITYTGKPELINGVCPCHECVRNKKNPAKEFWTIFVTTSTHVVYDEFEAKKSIVEFIYQSEDGGVKVKKLCGLNVELSEHISNMTFFNCVTHDKELVDRLEALFHQEIMFSQFKPPFPYGVMISYPHGLEKRITVGKILYCLIPLWSSCLEPLSISGHVKFRLKPKEWTSNTCRESQNVKEETLSRRKESLPEKLSSLKSLLQWLFDKFQSSDVSVNSFNQSSLERHSSDVDTIQPGEIYSLPSGLTFVLSGVWQKFLIRFPYTIEPVEDIWLEFPKGTRLLLENGRELFFSSISSVEFSWKDLRHISKFKYPHLIYDIHTCGGSSGASVLHEDGIKNSHPTFLTHAGAFSDDTNMSCLYNFKSPFKENQANSNSFSLNRIGGKNSSPSKTPTDSSGNDLRNIISNQRNHHQTRSKTCNERTDGIKNNPIPETHTGSFSGVNETGSKQLEIEPKTALEIFAAIGIKPFRSALWD